VSTRTTILAAVAAAVFGVLVVLLARGEDPSAQLQALEEDAMARYVPPGGTLVDTDSQNEGSSLGKPIFARHTRTFELPVGTAQNALRHARAAALASGWKEVGSDDDVFAADRMLPTGGAHLGVTVFRDARILPEDVRPPALRVSLRHRGS
jgi:hypothetical protein